MNMRTKAKIGWLFIFAQLLSVGAQAGPIKIWKLDEIAAAPVLVVARVINVQKDALVADGLLPWKAETWTMTANIEVLRSYTASGSSISSNRLRVKFLEYGGNIASMNGFPPPLAHLESGQIAILPLQMNKNPIEPWLLLADSGVGLIIPARVEIKSSGPQPASARAFLDREIANAERPN